MELKLLSIQLYPLPSLLIRFFRAFTSKDFANNGRKLPSYPLRVIALVNKNVTSFINEETIDAISEKLVGAIITPRNYPLYLFYFVF